MCQIHTISKTSFDQHTEQWLQHLDNGTKFNNDGHAALFIDEDTGNHALFRSMAWNDIRDTLTLKEDWTRVFIHQRATTRGGATLENTHFWQSDELFYCHNGVLRGDLQSQFRVDSLAIGHMLEVEGVWRTLEYLQSQDYANVFIIDMRDMQWYMSRSETNSLYSDGLDNYSTNMLAGICDQPVTRYSVLRHQLEEPQVETWLEKYNRRQIAAIIEDDDEAYEAAVKASMGGPEDG